MKQMLRVIGWTFLGFGGIGVLFFVFWALTASAHEGEHAFAIVFMVIAAAFLAAAGGAFYFAVSHGSTVGMAVSTVVLAVPPLLYAGIWIRNLVLG
jgi:hypothetical protein